MRETDPEALRGGARPANASIACACVCACVSVVQICATAGGWSCVVKAAVRFTQALTHTERDRDTHSQHTHTHTFHRPHEPLLTKTDDPKMGTMSACASSDTKHFGRRAGASATRSCPPTPGCARNRRNNSLLLRKGAARDERDPAARQVHGPHPNP